MFVDASVVVAILNREPDWEHWIDRLVGPLYVSPVTRYEAVAALARIKAMPTGRRPTPEIMAVARDQVDAFFTEIGAAPVDVTNEIGSLAIEASMRYGKAVGHPADLNMGDCFAYACAKSLGVPLLYKGDDFAKTDLA